MSHAEDRFSKLFLSHLESEFKKQESPALQNLIASQVFTSGLAEADRVEFLISSKVNMRM
jgi:hypothetical protein